MERRIEWVATAAVVSALAASTVRSQAPAQVVTATVFQPTNIALGKPYTMPKPNYSLCTDPDDRTQLTDGVKTEGYFWMQKTTVGWTRAGFKHITIDLGKVHSIGGVAVSSAGGVADVRWPDQVLVFVSDDGEAWYGAGDLVKLPGTEGATPPYGTYATHVSQRDDLRTYGRYVQIVVEAAGEYFFADEIEVYAGAFQPGDVNRGTPVTDIKELMHSHSFNRLIKQQLSRDLEAARADIADPVFPTAQRERFVQRAGSMLARISEMAPVSPEEFRAVLPMTGLERDVFRFQAEVWRARGAPVIRLWQKHRWDPLAPSEEPPREAPPPAIGVAMMANEHRADVLNVTNAAPTDQVCRLRIEGLPGGTNPGWLRVHEVLHVGTRQFVAVAAALPEAKRRDGDWEATVPSGMTRQVWFSFHPGDVAPGDYSGTVVVQTQAAGRLRVPLTVKLYPFRFPEHPTMNLGGWSYTNTIGARGVTAENRDALVKHLREHYVNAPWATPGVLPTGEYDEEGNMTREPDTAAFDAFVKLWPGARHYMVYVARGDHGNRPTGFAGAAIGTPRFERVVGTWIRFWGEHVRASGLRTQQLGLLIVDEPHGKEWYDGYAAYARVINRVEPDVTLWVDPQPNEAETCREMHSLVDVIVPHRPQALRAKDWFREMLAELREQGKQLGLYSAHGPARTFDPFSYYLLEPWNCFAIGGSWVGFWAFGGDSRFSVWNEYAIQGRGSYCPMYLDDRGVTAAKYMEAVREGVQDYEYLVMLRDRIRALEQQDATGAALAQAKELLASACDRVHVGEKGINYRWDEQKDRSVADVVRTEILEALSALAKE